MNYKVYIDDQLLDLSPNQVIGQTLQAGAIANGDLVSRITDYTNQFTVPLTNNNISILEQANFLKIKSLSPYVKKSCRILANGIQIMQGVAIVKAVENNFAIQVYSTPKTITYLLGTSVLSDLDFGDSAITWDAAFWDSRRNATTGWCCPVIEYGQVKKSISDGTIGDVYLPSIAVKDIVTAIFENIGYTVSGDFYDSDEYFNNLILTYSRKDWPVTGTVRMNEILSDYITQAKFLLDLQIKFGIWFRVSGKNVELVLLEDVLNDQANAIDWTEKRIRNIVDSIQFAWDDWAQSNLFKYPNPIKYLVPVTEAAKPRLLFDGDLPCLNQDIEIEKTIYESIFSPCQLSKDGFMGVLTYNVSSVSKNIFCATQRVWETEPSDYLPFDNEPLPMLLLLRDRNTTYAEDTIIYDVTPRSDYKVAYFSRTAYDDIATNVLRWSGVGGEVGLLDRYYRTLGAILATGSKKVTRYYMLNDLDIYRFDPLKLIFDDGDYFLVNKIFDYVSGHKTKVELLRASFTREREIVSTDVGALAIEGYAPSIFVGTTIFADTGILTIEGFAPSAYSTETEPIHATFDVSDAIPGNPVWKFAYSNSCDTNYRNLTSPETDGPVDIDYCSGSDLYLTITKVSNGGISQDSGTIEYKVNGSTVHTSSFINGATVYDTYTFSGLNPGDDIDVIVVEG